MLTSVVCITFSARVPFITDSDLYMLVIYLHLSDVHFASYMCLPNS